VSTKNDLLAAWVKWTDDPVREARHRIRVLSEDNLLPQRSAALTYDDLARALLGFLVADTHKDAAREVRQFSNFCCGAWEVGGDEILASSNLLQALSLALRPPFSVVALSVSPAVGTAVLIVIRNGDPFTNCEYNFTDVMSPRNSPRTTFPIVVTRSMYSDLIGRLVGLIDDASKSGASPAREAPQSTRPSHEGISETPRTEDRSLDNGDGIPCVCVSATPEAAGGQSPTVEAHHDEREPGD
jgi:hypothetical protein